MELAPMDGLVFPPLLPTQEVDAVFGLADPIRDAVRCSNCNKWFKGHDENGVSQSFTKHVNKTCLAGIVRSVIATANVQQFHSKSGTDRFPVRIPAPPPPIISPLQAYLQQRARQTAAQPAAKSVSDNHLVFHQFLDKERWIQHLEPYADVNLTLLHLLTLDDHDFPRLARHIERYLLDLQLDLDNYLARRLIGTRPASEYVPRYTLLLIR